MRELILKMSMTIDGFVASADGGRKWFMDTRDEKGMEWTFGVISDASLHIMGSGSFKEMAAYWPTASGPFAATMNHVPKAVFSKQGAAILPRADSLAGLQPEAQSWAEAYVATGELKEEIQKLKAQDGRPIIAHGGARFGRSLVASGLVDRYAIAIHAVAIGQGQPLFAGLTEPRYLKLLSSASFPRGTVANIYSPA
jgi:dihydrofolate reductase